MTGCFPTLRLPAEWEPQKSVMLAWPHDRTDWNYMLEEVQECFARIAKAITPHASIIWIVDGSHDAFVSKIINTGLSVNPFRAVHASLNDTWARDFGMICTTDQNGNILANDFKFNGWGLKFAACHDNLVNRAVFASGIIPKTTEYFNRLDFVLEGGSIESDGQGTLMTTSNCLLSPNRNGGSTKQEIEDALKLFFGARKVLWVDHGDLQGDDTDSHIDTLARLLPGNIIALSTCDREDDTHFLELKKMKDQIAGFTDADGRPFKLIDLPIPDAIYDEEGQRLPATYANFLLINGALILPVYDDSHYDKMAIRALSEALPGYDIVPVDCRALIKQHGSLHCVTMQLPF